MRLKGEIFENAEKHGGCEEDASHQAGWSSIIIHVMKLGILKKASDRSRGQTEGRDGQVPEGWWELLIVVWQTGNILET